MPWNTISSNTVRMYHLQQSCTDEFESLLWNHVLEMSCFPTTTTTSPSNILFSSIPCSSPHIESYPPFPRSSTSLQEQEGISLGVEWSESPTLITSDGIHPVFPLEKMSVTFLSKSEETHSFFTVPKGTKDAVIATTMWETAVVREYTQKHAKSQSLWRILHHAIMSISRVNVGGGRNSV